MEIDGLIVRKSKSDHYFQSLCLLRLTTCIGEMRSDVNAAWMNKIIWYSQNNHFKELNRIDGTLTKFEWKIFPGLTTWGLFKKIQDLMKDLQCGLEQFNRIIFMSMCNDIVWGENGNTEECNQNSIGVLKYARRFPCGRWSLLGPGSERKWDKKCSDEPDGNLDRTAEMRILQTSTESGHPIFRASSAFERGELDSREHGNKSTQFYNNERNIEMLLRTVISVNQLSIYGPVADRTPTHKTHLCSTVCSQAGNVYHPLGSSNHGLYFIFVRLKRICHLVLHMSHPLLFSRLPHSLFLLPIHKNTKNTLYVTHI